MAKLGQIMSRERECMTHKPRHTFIVVPTFAGTTMWIARAIHSLSSWRKPGPITPNVGCNATLAP